MRIWDFPTLAISKQLFSVPGAVVEGGITTGGARIMSNEPGGFATLELQPSWRDEFADPTFSWLMSKANGQVFRIRLAPTPQVVTGRNIASLNQQIPLSGNVYSHQETPLIDLSTLFTADALKGTNVVAIDMANIGPVLKHGHLIGHGDHCYMVDDITYSDEGVATITVTPPVRTNIVTGDTCLFRPFFLGMIANGNEMRKSYDAENAGWVQLERIVFTEALV